MDFRTTHGPLCGLLHVLSWFVRASVDVWTNLIPSLVYGDFMAKSWQCNMFEITQPFHVYKCTCEIALGRRCVPRVYNPARNHHGY